MPPVRPILFAALAVISVLFTPGYSYCEDLTPSAPLAVPALPPAPATPPVPAMPAEEPRQPELNTKTPQYSKIVPKEYCKPDYPSDAMLDWDCVRIKPRTPIEKVYGDAWQDVVRFNRIDRRHALRGGYFKIPRYMTDIKGFSPLPRTYPAAEKDAKFILIDLSEEFLGAYENGRLVMSFPIAAGEPNNQTPSGDFRVTAYSRDHRSSKYTIEKTDTPYPMHYALRFFINKEWVAFWIHGRDIPGKPASHGCVGLYDEEMQKKYYKYPQEPVLMDAKALYGWAIAGIEDDGAFHAVQNGPRVFITGSPP